MNLRAVARKVRGTEKKTAALAEGRHVMLLMGSTGSGKTTQVKNLVGEKIGQRIVEMPPKPPPEGLSEVNRCKWLARQATKRDVRYVLSVVGEDGSPHLKIGDTLDSCTTVVHAERLPAQCPPAGADDGWVGVDCVCDAPGAFDTRGAHADVAAAIAICSVLRRCRSVRLMVLVKASHLTDRDSRLLDLLRQLSGFLGRDLEANLGAVLFLFSHPKNASHDEITDQVSAILESEAVQSDARLQLIVTHMLNQLLEHDDTG